MRFIQNVATSNCHGLQFAKVFSPNFLQSLFAKLFTTKAFYYTQCTPHSSYSVILSIGVIYYSQVIAFIKTLSFLIKYSLALSLSISSTQNHPVLDGKKLWEIYGRTHPYLMIIHSSLNTHTKIFGNASMGLRLYQN